MELPDRSLYKYIDSMQMCALRQLFGPGVYILWNKNEALYVGSAKNIMHRISHPKHEQLRKAVEEATRIEFKFDYGEHSKPWHFDYMRDKEAKLILELQPKYNRTGKLGTTNRFSVDT